MFFKYITYILVAGILSIMTMSAAHAQVAQSTTTPELAKRCVTSVLRSIQQDPTSVKKHIDRKYIRQQISKTFGVRDVFLFFKQGAIRRATSDLASMSPMGADTSTIEITAILEERPSSGGYSLLGNIAGAPLELQAKFYRDGSCKIMDIRLFGSSMLAILMGRLATEKAFAAKLDDFYY